MLMAITLLSLISRIPLGVTLFHACIPNSQFRVNGRLCVCDGLGRWSESNCQPARRHSCTPGQIVWEDCNQCICQDNGSLICTNLCTDNKTQLAQITKAIDVSNLWCIPFVSYYVNCSLCVCPATGKMKDARCAVDATCPFRGPVDYLSIIKTQLCIPKVMYVFPCLRCLCSDDGFFTVNKCVETCKKTAVDKPRCSPRKFFRKGCNVCFCPENSIVNERLCTKNECNGVQLQSLASLRSKSRKCLRQKFTGPKCFYCECGSNRAPNENSCLEIDCIGTDHLKPNFESSKCSPGEMVSYCMDCVCLRNGITNSKYCTEKCTNEQKVAVLKNAIKESFVNRNIVNRKNVADSEGDVCEPNSIYKEKGKYCLCSNNGETRLNLCTPVFKESKSIDLRAPEISIDFNAKCDPNTFVEFDCNTCYCMKTGRIDPKWCTYDDCAAKRMTMESNKINIKPVDTITKCIAGSLTKVDCNYCICPENGLYKDRVCTKNSCTDIKPTQNELTCEPLAYYTIDCNICYCPKNGMKNIDRCTKNICEKNFLRSEACVRGRLFSDECNVCVCPPNGNKAEKICTNRTCEHSDTPWKQIFKLSQSLFSHQIDDATWTLELCFPGEEFEVGCKVCLCPDMGLRAYATCTEVLCNNHNDSEEKGDLILTASHRIRRKGDCGQCRKSQSLGNVPADAMGRDNVCEPCFTQNVDMPEKACTPGSMYIIRCQQCICPYMGNINHFCRPMPEGMYCEQAFPKIDYMPMRRKGQELRKSDNVTSTPNTTKSTVTTWLCDKPGRVMDECYICECTDNVIIKEKCFLNDSQKCVNAVPTFLVHNNSTGAE